MNDHEVRIFVDDLTEGYTHACSVEDVTNQLKRVPSKDLEGLAFVLLHQPTRKEERRSPRWGAYFLDYKYEDVEGPAILLEAIDLSKPLKWSVSLSPDDQKELLRLEKEGHEVVRSKKEILISMDAPSVRRTQLRTLFHELGHHVDRMSNPEYFKRKSKGEKEHFAHKYSEKYLEL